MKNYYFRYFGFRISIVAVINYKADAIHTASFARSRVYSQTR